MAKQSQLDRAIAEIEQEILVRQLALDRLLEQRAKTPKRKPSRSKPKVVEPKTDVA